MEISGKNHSVNLETYVKNIKDKRTINETAHPTSQVVLNEDKVVLSPKAKEIQEATKILSSLPDIREEKVGQIKMQIDNETYQINGKKIAINMAKESLINELL
jgi:negative regulator of flagellin synthesis FlgM